jgi:hypothetical protein
MFISQADAAGPPHHDMDAIELLQDRVDELRTLIDDLKRSAHVPEPGGMLSLLELNDALSDVADQLREFAQAQHAEGAADVLQAVDTPEYRATRMRFWKSFMPAMVVWWVSQDVKA